MHLNKNNHIPSRKRSRMMTVTRSRSTATTTTATTTTTTLRSCLLVVVVAAAAAWMTTTTTTTTTSPALLVQAFTSGAATISLRPPAFSSTSTSSRLLLAMATPTTTATHTTTTTTTSASALSLPRTLVESYYEYDSYYNTIDTTDNDDAATTKKTKTNKKSKNKTKNRSESSASRQQKQQPNKTASTKTTKRKKSKSSSSSLHHSTHRVTPEQEVELARIIQQGAALHKLRQEYCNHAGGATATSTSSTTASTTISAKEWADLAGITTKELRRQVTAYRQAKHELVTANMGLVHAVVNQMMSQQQHANKEELIQEGSLGLLRAAELFDPSRGLRFSTYAVVWIKGVLRNSHTTELVKLPSREKTKWNKIQQAQRDILMQQHSSHGGACSSGQVVVDDAVSNSGNAMTLRVPIEELSAATGFSPSEILMTHRRMSQAQKVLSLDYQYTSQSRSGDDKQQKNSIETTAGAAAALSDDENGDFMAERTQLQADVLTVLARNLNAREGQLMRLRYGLGGGGCSDDDKNAHGRAHTLQECAEMMGLSYTRVQQLSKKCLQKLRQAAEAESLEEYLLTIA